MIMQFRDMRFEKRVALLFVTVGKGIVMPGRYLTGIENNFIHQRPWCIII
jgi:hypothetical protein